MPIRPKSCLRPARAADLPALLAIEAQFPGDRMSRRQFRHHLTNPCARLVILVEAGMPRGYFLLLLRPRSRGARLYSIAVDAASRGRQFGAQLLRAAERQARRAGYAILRLEVRRDNAIAIALYERHGYRLFGVHLNYYADGADALRYEKSLLRPSSARSDPTLMGT